MPDYLADARIKKVPFTKFKSFLQEKGAPKADLFAQHGPICLDFFVDETLT